MKFVNELREWWYANFFIALNFMDDVKWTSYEIISYEIMSYEIIGYKILGMWWWIIKQRIIWSNDSMQW